MQRDWQWYCSDWTSPSLSLAIPEFELLTSKSVVMHSFTVEQEFCFSHLTIQVFNSGAEEIVLVLI